MYASDTSRNTLQSCLVFIRSSIFYRKPLFEQTLTHPMSSFYHIWLKQFPKEHELKRWETRRRRAGEIAFVYQNNKKRWINNIGEQIIVIYIWKFDGKGYACLENQAFFGYDLCRLRVISHLHWWSNSEVFRRCQWLSLNKSSGEFSIGYRKNTALLWLRVYNHDFVL